MLSTLRKVRRRVRHALGLPAWLVFSLSHRGYRRFGQSLGLAGGLSRLDAAAIVARHEEILRSFVVGRPDLRFLEIGIGAEPIIGRMKLLRESGTIYTGVDFDSVCRDHLGTLVRAGFPVEGVEYIGNRTGTYAWTLFDLMRSGRRFDVVYLDGHHTFYVDLPAFVLADRLLEPGGWLLVDDIRWTLAALRQTLTRQFSAWRFYHRQYDWSVYTGEQRSIPHVGLIAEALLIRELGYGLDETRSTPYWWALRKPPHDLPTAANPGLSVLG